MTGARTELRKLTLPYAALETVYQGDCEVRQYRNELTGQLQVGKRIDILGMEEAVAFREGELLQHINHQHLAKVHEVVEVSGYPEPMRVIELIMPWYERGSVCDALLRGEQFSVGEAITLMAGGLLGVAELHECHGILHRDLKSPNFFLSDDNRLLVGDLGAAVPMDTDGSAEALAAPRLYSPPESLIVGRLNRRSEIYQCGLVLHELVSGSFPYNDPKLSIDFVASRLVKGRPALQPVHLRHAPWVPRGLRSVINKALRVDPAVRYPSTQHMSRALNRVTYVDWHHIIDDPDRKRWEGTTVHRPDRRFAVDAKLMPPNRRRGKPAWALSGLQHVNRWQRVIPDAPVMDLYGAQATHFFDQMVVSATNR